MAVNYVKGQILSSILERDGIDLSIANANVGINTNSPTARLEVVGNVKIGNVAIDNAGTISATGNITGGNLVSVAFVGGATANITGNIAVGNLSTTGNVAAGNVLTDNLLYANGAPWDLQEPAGSNTQIQFNNNSQFGANANFTFDTSANLLTVNATANIANINVVGSANVQGNVNGGNILTVGLISATGTITSSTTITGGNLATGGTISGTGNVTGGNIITGGTVSSAGNINTGANISAAGNIFAANFVGNISGNLGAPGANTQVVFNDNGTANATAGFTFEKTTNAVVITGNVSGANLLTGGAVTATANVTGGNIITGGQVSATANVTGSNIVTSGQITATANVTGGNLITAGVVSATTGNIANLRIANTTITTDSTIGNIVINPTGSGVAYIQTTTGMIIPVGNTAQRPSPATQGTIRFNTQTLRVEVYDGTEWDTIVGGVTNQVLYGDGSTTTFTLDRSTTTAAALIMLNGITQIPGQSYNMNPNPSTNLVFTEAPSTSDIIDIRFL